MEFTHFDQEGSAAMVDVSGKAMSAREAVACGSICMGGECFRMAMAGGIKKGDVLGTARVAAVMGAKRTSELIPLCHNLPLSNVEIYFETDEDRHRITAYCRVRTEGRTGVEMEALTGVQIALLTIYDMCKAADPRMKMTDIHLCQKTGGRSGHFVYEQNGQGERV